MNNIIEKVVLEELNKFMMCESQGISYGTIAEKDNSDSSKKHKKKKSSKTKDMFHKRKEKSDRRDGKEVSSTDAEMVRDFLNDPTVNVSDVMVRATRLADKSASSLGAKIAKGDRPVKAKLAHVVRQIQNKLS